MRMINSANVRIVSITTRQATTQVDEITNGLCTVGFRSRAALPPRARLHTPWHVRADRSVDGISPIRYETAGVRGPMRRYCPGTNVAQLVAAKPNARANRCPSTKSITRTSRMEAV